MEEGKQTDYVKKKFGHCVINWRIENFCLMASNDHCLYVYSPEIYINEPQLTKWWMIICPNWNNYGTSCVWFCLKNLDCEEKTGSLKTYWKLWLLDSKGNCLYVTQSNGVFRANTEDSAVLPPTEDIVKKLHPFQSDTLNLRCRLVFKFASNLLMFEKLEDTGLNTLSSDLKKLIDSKYTDISINTNNGIIQTHKAILYTRNNYLSAIIHNLPPNKTAIELPQVDYEAMEMVVAYFYSGDLEFVISKPTIALYECISLLNIGELKSYYIADELIIHSTIPVEEISFLWMIPDFSTRGNDCIFSPILNNGISDTNWRLRLHPRGIRENEFMAFYAEITDGINPKVICIDIAVINEKEELFWVHRITKTVAEDTVFKLENFVRWEQLENSSLLANDMLRIVVKIRTSNLNWKSSEKSYMSTKIPISKKEGSLDYLSMNMDTLFRKSYYADIIVQCEAARFISHSCILAARSPVLARKLLRVSENKIVIRNIKPKIMYIVLRYIYNGISRDFERDDLWEIYEAADSLGIWILKDTCSQIMQLNM